MKCLISTNYNNTTLRQNSATYSYKPKENGISHTKLLFFSIATTKPVEPLKHQAMAISKPTSKQIKLGKKSRGGHLNSFPLHAIFSNPDLNIEDLDEDELRAIVFDHPQLPLGVA